MELRDYLDVIRARKWLVIGVTLLVGGLALGVSLLEPRVYQSEALLVIAESDAGTTLLGANVADFAGEPERGLQTQVELVQLRPVLEEVTRQLSLQMTPEELEEDLDVAVAAGTSLISVRARSESPEAASDIANAVAHEYVRRSQEGRRESIGAAATELESRLRDVEAEIRELGRRLSDEDSAQDLETEIRILAEGYSTLAEQLVQLQINEELETGAGRVVSEAVATDTPVSPTPLRDTLAGLGVGLVAGLGAAFLAEYLDEKIRDAAEVERLTGVPVLGSIPWSSSSADSGDRLAVADDAGSSEAEGYRVLRSSLAFVNFEGGYSCLLITSALAGEGKSTVASNLALSLAQAGHKTVLVSTDFRRPSTQRFFGIANTIGLSDVLLGSNSLKAALQRPGDEPLLILTSGKMPPNPSELLASEKMGAVFQELDDWADWIVVDAPPLLAVADPAAVSRWADGVALVVQAGESSREALSRSREMLDRVGADLVGTIVMGSTRGSDVVGYGEYYLSGYASDTVEPQERRAASFHTEPTPGRSRRFLLGMAGFSVVLFLVFVVAYLLDTILELDVFQSMLYLW